MNETLLQTLTDPKVVVLAMVVILLAAGLTWLYLRKRSTKSAELRQRFGREYEQAVRTHGSTRLAEAKLTDREKRIAKLKIRELDSAEQERFSSQWTSVQSRFIDFPKGAVTDAADLVLNLMLARGYPVADFDQCAADISVGHPNAVANYRSAHAIELRLRTGQASTEDLRSAMIYYRSLFEELVQSPMALEGKPAA